MKWFTSDQHFGHSSVIEFCHRPFKNADRMDKALIRLHNEVVGEDDDVYILGDFSLKAKNHKGYYLDVVPKLKGRLHLILGNHDVRNPVFLSEVGFYSVHYPYLEVDEFICCHDPALSAVDRNRQFLCGHVHDLFRRHKNVLNVGVDVNNYKPISIEQIREELKSNEQREEVRD